VILLTAGDGYKPPEAATSLARSTGQNINQILFRVGESMELLSNQVLAPFLSRIDGKNNEVTWELKVCQWSTTRDVSLFDVFSMTIGHYVTIALLTVFMLCFSPS